MALVPMTSGDDVIIGSAITASSSSIASNTWGETGDISIPSISGYDYVGALVYPASAYLKRCTANRGSGIMTATISYYNSYSSTLGAKDLYLYPVYRKS